MENNSSQIPLIRTKLHRPPVSVVHVQRQQCHQSRIFTSIQQPMTILIGTMNDQPSLSSVNNALYGEHLPVLSVEMLEER